jgi:hypothetical protein
MHGVFSWPWLEVTTGTLLWFSSPAMDPTWVRSFLTPPFLLLWDTKERYREKGRRLLWWVGVVPTMQPLWLLNSTAPEHGGTGEGHGWSSSTEGEHAKTVPLLNNLRYKY